MRLFWPLTSKRGKAAESFSLAKTTPGVALHKRHKLNIQFDESINLLRKSGELWSLAAGLVARAEYVGWLGECSRVQSDLDEAWEIAERSPMRLLMADIHLHRARLFFREKPYPWNSPQDNLAAAEKLITDCGYHRRDQELADAKRAILGV